ncbi:ParB N-terminal domain-containing protein [Streptomyces sp. NBC_01221]|uniref:ParB N-terminal domain-containing protein n=1 Tax=Streptomyces sp. NBC_01221 TaxID=2903782 RepID=UPI002250780C|nr:ParB N-terminal domain-containing protein [Streptomyces sp. NBC_01221]MCX4792572.1 ParB N-terminal domain-containing protein [Streptomyces sp. NBC_01221]
MTSTSIEAPPDGGSMIRLTEILHRSVKLRQRRFEMLPLRGPGAPFTEAHARNPSDSLPPSELADLISSMSVVGLLEPVLAEEILVDGKAPTIRLVTGERRLRAMRWGAINRPDNPHFQALPAVVCPGPLSDEERHMWRFVENFAREPLRPGEQAAALLYQRCAILVGKLLKSGKPVPQEVYAIPDPAERFQALEKIRGTDTSCAAPWSEVLDRLGLQLNERKAGELVRAFRALPRDLTEEMDEAAVRLHTRIRFAELRNGRAEAAQGIWAALKTSKRLHLLPTAVSVALEEEELGPDAIIAEAEERQDAANAGRRAKLTRVPDTTNDQETAEADEGDPLGVGPGKDGAEGPETVPLPAQGPGALGEEAGPEPSSAPAPPRPAVETDVIRTALDGVRSLLVEIRAGKEIARYDRGSLRLALRELSTHLEEEAAAAQPGLGTTHEESEAA